jgi:hypothetical protein
MSNIMPDRTPTQGEIRFSTWDNVRWSVGNRTHSLGEYVLKLGDRIHGDAPMGLDEAYKLGHAMGKRKPGEAVDMDKVFSTVAAA